MNVYQEYICNLEESVYGQNTIGALAGGALGSIGGYLAGKKVMSSNGADDIDSTAIGSLTGVYGGLIGTGLGILASAIMNRRKQIIKTGCEDVPEGVKRWNCIANKLSELSAEAKSKYEKESDPAKKKALYKAYVDVRRDMNYYAERRDAIERTRYGN